MHTSILRLQGDKAGTRIYTILLSQLDKYARRACERAMSNTTSTQQEHSLGATKQVGFRLPSPLGTGAVSPSFLEARGDILRYTDTGRRGFPYTLPPYDSGKPQPIGSCWGVGRPAPAVLRRASLSYWFSEEEKQTFSLSQTPSAEVPFVPVPTGLSSHSHQLQLRHHKERQANWEQRSNAFHRRQ